MGVAYRSWMAGRRDRSRRQVLGAAGVATAGVVVAGLGRHMLLGDGVDRRGPNALLPYITPTEDFYKFVNGPWPAAATGAETLSISGGDRSRTLAWQDLLELPRRTALRTIVCDGNGYRGAREPIAGCAVGVDPEESSDHPEPERWTWRYGGIGTAEWGGMPLRALFEAAGVPMNGSHVAVEGRDGYARWLPTSAARTDDFLVVLSMNGALLPHKHGAPARLIAPGQYGGMCVKWIRSLSCGPRIGAPPWDGGSASHFPVKPQGFASAPLDGASVPAGEVELVGGAYAGERPVGQVLLTVSGEDPVPAELVDPARPYVWSRWRATLQLHQPGNVRVSVGVADDRGRTSMPQSPWGDAVGYGGLHELRLTVT